MIFDVLVYGPVAGDEPADYTATHVAAGDDGSLRLSLTDGRHPFFPPDQWDSFEVTKR